MSKKGATSAHAKKAGNAKGGGGGKSEVHNLRALGLGLEKVEKIMVKVFGDTHPAQLSPEELELRNKAFMEELNKTMKELGLHGKSNDPEDKRVMEHVDPSLTPNNEFLILHPLDKFLEETLKPLVKEKTGRAMQDICTPYKEDVLVIKPDTTIQDLQKFGKEVENELGWHPMQFFIHHDEGHIDEESGEWKENHHAHIVFNTINYETGKTTQLNRFDLARMQSIAAETLGMERGENSSDLAHIDSVQFKEMQRLAELQFKMAKAVVGIGMDPTKIMVDALNKSIDDKMTDKPNNRPLLNLLREVGKDLNTNPTKRCTDAIFEKLQQQPDKVNAIADILGVSKNNGKEVKDAETLMADVYKMLDFKATYSGKTETAKTFRPVLNSAKELGLDLNAVILPPIREAIADLQSKPMDVESNNRLWCAVLRTKNDPSEMLQNVLDNGISDLKAQANIAVVTKQVAEEKTDEIKDSLISIAQSDGKVIDKSITIDDAINEAKTTVSDLEMQANDAALFRDAANHYVDEVTDKLKDVIKSTGSDVDDDAELPMVVPLAVNSVNELKKTAEKSISDLEKADDQSQRISKTMDEIIIRSGVNVDTPATLNEKLVLATNVVKDMRSEVRDLKEERKAIQADVSKDMKEVKEIAGYTDDRLIADRLIKHLDKLIADPSSATREDAYSLGQAMYFRGEQPSVRIASKLTADYLKYDDKTFDNLCKTFNIPKNCNRSFFTSEIYFAAIDKDAQDRSFSKDNIFANILKPKTYVNLFANEIRTAIDGYGEKVYGAFSGFNHDKLTGLAKCFNMDETKIIFDSSIDLKKKFEKELDNAYGINKQIYGMLPFLKEFVNVNKPDPVPKDSTPLNYINYAREIMIVHDEIRSGLSEPSAAYDRGLETGRQESKPIITKLQENISSLNEELDKEKGATANEKNRADNAVKELERFKDAVCKSALNVKPIQTLYDAGLKIKDSIIELYTTMKTRFTGTLLYDGENLKCKDKEVTIKRGDDDPYIDNININEMARTVRELRIMEEAEKSKFIQPDDEPKRSRGMGGLR